MSEIEIRSDNRAALLPDSVRDRNQLSRLGLFCAWLDHEGYSWHAPDLAAYRDHLLHTYKGKNGKPLQGSSVKVHLATIRGRYRAILRQNSLRDDLYNLTAEDESLADRKALVDEFIVRLTNDIDPLAVPVKVIQKQDVSDSEHIRLTAMEAMMLIAAPGLDTLVGLRDTAILALMLATGLREGELVALDVADLRQALGGELAVLVREGKGGKQRLVPYGEMLLNNALLSDIRFQHAANFVNLPRIAS